MSHKIQELGWGDLATLILAAQGRIKPDIIIKNVNWVNVVTGEVIGNSAIVVMGKYIVRVGNIRDLSRYVSEKTFIIDGKGYYAVPGFIDAHVHIESSMLTVTEFSKLALMHGTTSVVADPHEIANVLGYEGIKLFIEEAKYVPLRVFFEVPSCVPATDPSLNLETPGHVLNHEVVSKLLEEPSIIGLGEVMDFISVLNASEDILRKIVASRIIGKVIDGHAPLLNDEQLDAYILAGISSCHESVFEEEGLRKLRKGMYLMVREGSAWKDLKEVIKVVTKRDVDTRRVLLISDDTEVRDLIERGYMDYIVRSAIEEGVDPIKAIQMVTINAAEHLRLDDRLGIIAPGRLADIVLLRDMKSVSVSHVFVDGKLIVKDGKYVHRAESKFKYPRKAYETVKFKPIEKVEDLLIKAEGSKAVVNIIEVIPGKALTKWGRDTVPIVNGYLSSDLSKDIVHICVIERHHHTGNIGKGFVKGFKIKEGAIAQTIAHDTHNLIVMGTDPHDMLKAINEIKRSGGGIVVVSKGRVIGKVVLPIAGLMSDKKAERVYEEVKDIEKAFKTVGIDFSNSFLTLGLIALPVIPELRITDKGLVDVMNAKLVDTVIEVIP